MRYRQLLFERNILNIADIEQFTKQMATRAHSQQIKAWLTTMLPSYLKKTYQKTQPVDASEADRYFQGELPAWAENGLRTGDLLKVQLDNELREKVSQTVDYLESEAAQQHNLGRIPFEVALQRSEQWHQALAAVFNITDRKLDSDGIKLFKAYPYGFKWVILTDKACLDHEGNIMGHCVGGGGYDERVTTGNLTIFSLRDASNDSHVTAAIAGKIVEQVKGKQNKAPIAIYRPYVIDLLNTLDAKSDMSYSDDLEDMGIFRGPKGFGSLAEVANLSPLVSGHKWAKLSGKSFIVDKDNTPLATFIFANRSLDHFNVPDIKNIRNDIIEVFQSLLKTKTPILQPARYMLEKLYGLSIDRDRTLVKTQTKMQMIARDLFFRAYKDKDNNILVADTDDHPIIRINQQYSTLQPGWEQAIPVLIKAITDLKTKLDREAIDALKKQGWFFVNNEWQQTEDVIKKLESVHDFDNGSWYNVVQKGAERGSLWLVIGGVVKGTLYYFPSMSKGQFEGKYVVSGIDKAFVSNSKEIAEYVNEILYMEVAIIKSNWDYDGFLINYDVYYGVQIEISQVIDWEQQVDVHHETYNVKGEVVNENKYKTTLRIAATDTSQDDDDFTLNAFAGQVVVYKKAFELEQETDISGDVEHYYADPAEYRLEHKMKPNAQLPGIRKQTTSVWI